MGMFVASILEGKVGNEIDSSALVAALEVCNISWNRTVFAVETIF